jgi:hypothetical protein
VCVWRMQVEPLLGCVCGEPQKQGNPFGICLAALPSAGSAGLVQHRGGLQGTWRGARQAAGRKGWMIVPGLDDRSFPAGVAAVSQGVSREGS